MTRRLTHSRAPWLRARIGEHAPEDIGFSAEDIDMKQANQTALAGLGRNEDGRGAARVVALSTGLLFSLILVLKALSW